MPASEFKEWLLFAAEEPFGDTRLEYLAAMIAYTQARVAGSKKSKFSDFLLFNNRDSVENPSSSARQAGMQIQAAFLTAAAGLKKRVIMKKRR